MVATKEAGTARRGAWIRVGIGVAILLMVLLRCVALDSDAYPRLTWSTALLSDEGFYLHNARNLIQFGKTQTDEFNNMLIMPILHLMQIGVFRVLGVGIVPARLISVVLSLVMLPLFFVTLRRVFRQQVAVIGTLFLGLDHITLLYNRLALMDTPAIFVMVCAFYAFVRGYGDEKATKKRDFLWLGICGFLLGVVYVTRGLAVFLVPLPFALLLRDYWEQKKRDPSLGVRSRLRGLGWLAGGLVVALLIYAILWYLPHRLELAHANRHYLFKQLVPASGRQFRINVMRGLTGYQRGMMPYLFRHSPVQLLLVFGWFMWWLSSRRLREGEEKFSRLSVAVIRLLNGWFVLGFGMMCVVTYSPSRYYVLYYPAMAALSALAAVRIPSILRAIWLSRGISGVWGGVGGYLVAQLVLYHLYDAHWVASYPSDTSFLLWGAVSGGVLFALKRNREVETTKQQLSQARMCQSVLVLWLVINSFWLGDWATHLTFRQKEADRWLETNLPKGSVLLGAIAPGLSMNNGFQVVTMIEFLCNDNRPVEKFAPAPRYILMLDNGGWKEKWWVKHYPTIVQDKNRIHLFKNLLRPYFEIAVYQVPSDFVASAPEVWKQKNTP